MPPITITGELTLPQILLQRWTMPALEAQLQALGVLPAGAEQRRWRMDTDTPGNYRLSYTLTLPAQREETPDAQS